MFAIILCACFYLNHAEVTWQMEPQDVIAFTGESVTINCIASGTNSSRAEREFQWYKLYDQHRLSQNHILLSSAPTDRMSVSIDKARKRYSLTIHNLTEADNGQFQCILKDGNVPEIHSDVIMLTVIKPPTEGYTPCKHYNGSKMLLTPSELATIRCESMLDDYMASPSTTPSAHSSWPDGDRILSAYYLQNGTVLLEETMKSKNTAKFCSTNSRTLFAPESCTLLTHLPKLPVLVYPSHKVVNTGDDLTFQCVMVQSWEIVEYRWYIEGPLQPSSMFLTNNSRSLCMRNVKGEPGDYKIKCQVTDRWSLSVNATAIIRMNGPPVTTTTASTLLSSTSVTSTTATHVSSSSIKSKSQPKDVLKSPASLKIQHISILVGPMLACILLFIFVMIVLWFHSKLKKERQSLKNEISRDHKAMNIGKEAVQLRGRRYSDSVINRQSVLYETDYENVDSAAKHRSLYFDQPTKNGMRGSHSMMQPVHANLNVKIEVPNLAAALSQSDPNIHAIESCLFPNRDSVCSAVTDTTFVKTETIIETENNALIDINELAEEDFPPPLPAPRKPNIDISNKLPENHSKDHYYVNLGRQARLQRIPPIPPPRSCNGNLPCGLPFRRSNSEILHPGQINISTT
ncbi:uncharacterized protein LOC117102939 [Anneissia japonica]|uniref:uncharacterized protein LOC117102939 n=1 Tax=Anneissia japonica TaxID=1529436 RepID=UPI0014255975|nr:uncharacterized protein LOC117102939 [Anneissia japonica]